MKTHYEYYLSEDDEEMASIEYTSCGILLPEFYSLSKDWDLVNCKKCLKNKASIMGGINLDEARYIQQLGDMADFFKSLEGKE